MKRRWLWLTPLLVVALLVGVLLLVFATETGTRWSLMWAARFVPGELTIGRIVGTLSSPLELQNVRYRQNGEEGTEFEFALTRFRLDWHPTALVRGEVYIVALALRGLDIAPATQPAKERPEAVAWPPPTIQLPMALVLEELTVDDIAIRTADAPVRVDRLRLVAGADADAVRIDTLEVAAPTFQVHIKGSVTPRGDYPLQASLQWSATLPDDLRLEGEGSIDGHLNRFQIRHHLEPPFPLDVEGYASLKEGQPTVDLRGMWQNLHWPPSGDPWVSSKQGTLRVQGGLEAYEVQLDALLQGEKLPAGQWRLEGSGGLDALNVARLNVATLGGALEAHGKIAWQPEVSWNLRLVGEDLDPGKQWSEWPGQVGFQAASEGHWIGTSPEGQIRLGEVKGTLRGYAIDAHGNLAARGNAYQIPELELRAGSARVHVQGELADRWNLRLTFDAENLRCLLPGASGSLNGSAKLAGPRNAPQIEANLRGSKVVYESNHLRKLAVDLNVDLQDVQDSRIKITAQNALLGGQEIQRLDVRGGGKIAAHTLKASVKTPKERLSLDVAGGLAEEQWRGRLHEVRVETEVVGDWALVRPVALALSAAQARLGQTCWKQGRARLCAAGAWDKHEGWDAKAHIAALPLTRLRPWLPSEVALDGTLNGEFSGDGEGEAIRAEARVTLSPGDLKYHLDDEQQFKVAYRDGALRARLEEGALTAELGLVLVGQGTVNAGLGVFPVIPGKPLGASRVQGRVQAEISQLGLLSAFVPLVEDTQGTVSVDLDLAGTVATPQLKGTATLAQGSVRLPVAGIHLEDLRFTAASQGGTTLSLQGSAKSGPGQLSLEGQFILDARQGWPLMLAVKGDRFEATHLPEARVFVSPDLTLALREQRIDLSGTLSLPEAKITLRELPQSAVPVSQDVQIEGAEQEDGEGQALPEQAIYARVTLNLGEKVAFEGFGLSAKITGSLLAIDTPGEPTQGEGELHIVSGKYRAYGQKLDITQGRLVFAGPMDNPGLDVRAVRITGDVTAGIQVTGTLKSPQIELFSEPAMAQSEALSYLLLGRPLNQASTAEGNMLTQAALSLGLKGGNFLAQKIGTKLGLDEVAIQTQDSPDTAQLVAGKYLSPKLYVSYGAGLFATKNTLRVRYSLTKAFSIQAEGGDQSAVDVIYSIEFQ